MIKKTAKKKERKEKKVPVKVNITPAIKVTPIDRIPSGIPGLDNLIGGGLVKKSMTLLTGVTGAGKTIFCSQFLWEGLQKGEPCIYLSLGEDPDQIKADALQFGWDFDKYEKKGIFRIIFYEPVEMTDFSSTLLEEIKQINAKRIVIDPVSIFGLYVKDAAAVRKKLYRIISSIKSTNCTSIMTSEVLEDSKALSRFGVEEFVSDAVIVLNYFGLGEMSARSLIVRKMRRTDHGKDVYPFDITKKGIIVKKV
jgi:KaiC/GvpD/RAD55 family RecA-like ATPase